MGPSARLRVTRLFLGSFILLCEIMSSSGLENCADAGGARFLMLLEKQQRSLDFAVRVRGHVAAGDTRARARTYLFPQEAVHPVYHPGDGDVDAGQDESGDDGGAHPHRQQRVDDVDEEHGPPDALRGAPGLHEQDPDHLDHDHHQDDGVAHDPHVVLVEGVPVAHHHEDEREDDGQGEDGDEGQARPRRRRRPRPGAVEAQHDREDQHQHRHEHSQAALVQTEEVALVEPLQLLRLEFLGRENAHDADAARH